MVQPIMLEPTTWYNPELKTAIYVVPGLVGVILTMTMTMLTAMAIARERERGTLEQLIVSPVRKIELIAGKILPYIAIGYVQMSARAAVRPSRVRACRYRDRCRSCTRSRRCSSRPTWRSGCSSRPWRRRSSRRCRCRSSSCCRTSCCRASCSRSKGMPLARAVAVARSLPLTHFLRIVRGITLKGASFTEVQFELCWLVRDPRRCS